MRTPIPCFAISQSLTLHTVAEAASNSLRLSVKNPCLGSPHDPRRHVEWELDNVVLPHLRIIRKVWESAVASASTPSNVRSSVIDALRLVQVFLREIDWNSSGRNPSGESLSYRWILEEVVQICRSEGGHDLMISVETLAIAFSHLIDEDDWELTASRDSDVQQCRTMLFQMRSTVEESSSPQTGGHEAPAS